jgi:uncharacterized protein YcaQ
MKISIKHARRMAINAQLLDGRTKLSKGKEGVAQTIENLGYIQIDTISVIQRAHHHTLWTRCPDYDPEMLHELQAEDRRIFEYWGHAASYLPITDYRFYLPRMRGFLEPHQKWEKRRLEKYSHMMKPVLERIRAEGPLGSKDFTPPKDAKRGTWWDWRPAKVALELLFWRGELMITERRKFARIYDLTERVLPNGVDMRMPDEEELGRFLVRRALKAYGIANESEIREHIHGTDKAIISQGLRDLIDSGEVVNLSIDKIKKNEYYALSDKIETASRLRKSSPRLFLLSPFDNLIIQRERIKRLFGFDYALECYVPAPKRKFGYFVLPILWGENFIGRLDPKADRKNKTLIIHRLILEPGITEFEEILPPLAEKLWDFARFNGCERIELKKTVPGAVKKPLAKLLK